MCASGVSIPADSPQDVFDRLTTLVVPFVRNEQTTRRHPRFGDTINNTIFCFPPLRLGLRS